MSSTLESYKNFPNHIKILLNELHNSDDTLPILASYIPLLTSDTTLYNIFLNFSYSPEHGNFLSVPQSLQLINCIIKEYSASIPDTEENNIKILNDVKKEFLHKFSETNLQNLISPSEVNFCQGNDDENNEFWDDFENFDKGQKKVEYQEINSARINKGLKILSKKIREILISKGNISYKEMSEMVVDEMENSKEIDREKEGKNILRRIYDSLNVLEACDVVGKSEKKYFWKGFPSPQTENNEKLSQIMVGKKSVIENKREFLRDQCKRFYSLRELIKRNANNEKNIEKIELPFIIIGTEDHHLNKARIESNKKKNKINLKFHKEIKLYGDSDVLVLLGLYRRPMYSSDMPADLFESLACSLPNRVQF